ncbi:MAG: S1C family serine protease [Akkermansiaceae bacterium]
MYTHHFSTKGIKSSSLAMGILCLGLVSCSQIPALGQSSLSGDLRMNGKQVEAAFETQRAVLQQSSAAIYKGTRPIGYGVIMSSDGYILTKRSELFLFDPKTKKSTLKQGLKIIIDTDRYAKVTLLASDIEWDLAILKIDAKNLTPVEWASPTDIEQGTWVVTNGSSSKSRRRVNVGIISAHAREIQGDLPVMLGVGLLEKDDESGIEITNVAKDSGAEAAGILKGDIIKKFDGLEVTKREQIIDIIREKQPGDFVEVEFLRADKTLKQKMELKPRKEVQGEAKKVQNRNDQMSGDFSERRNSFPMALQHDIDQNSRQMGGPLLNLAGKAVGINIARANRAESFAIPAKEAQKVYQEMLKTIPQ